MFDKSLFLTICNDLYDSYSEKVANIPPVDGCMLKSENFCFVALCKMFDIDVIIESGLYFGASTQMFCEYFPSKKIYTIDTEVLDSATQTLDKYDNIVIREGNGHQLLPEIIQSIDKSKKIAVFIDGPKGREQFTLARSVVDKVAFVALHDVGEEYCSISPEYGITRETYENFISWDDSIILTTDDWYSDKYAHMNKKQLKWLKGDSDTGFPVRDDDYDSDLWNPIIERLYPKGFGLGVAVSNSGHSILRERNKEWIKILKDSSNE